MKKLVLLIMLFLSSASYAGTLIFSGSITAPPCKVEITNTKKIVYKNTVNCVPVMKKSEINIHKENKKDIKGKIVTVTYI
ncbi:hypothetical protein C0W80_18855 [Photobacterium leiognathi subsp. mandapamensis]|uniref:hypothetical protein n=1 Tax=Photobacterium leiognathi TaxID=553611 RepID=UPI000D151753|nr:hypothetical protein [Photobacterium leiognathi]PSU95234.1 hypothetical protein C0W80_18855 [Photobacterium leiognathi subsp. mandapamensis]